MASQSFDIENTTVHVYKRRGTRSLRLTIAADGKVKVTIPSWASYGAGVKFARSRLGWIQDNMPDRPKLLGQGWHVGKAHRLVFDTADTDTVKTRLAGSEIRILRPPGMMISHPESQEAARRAGIRALRIEAAKLLPPRLRQLADQHGFSYGKVGIKQLTGRWGSCDHERNITLNLYLMQLPWHLIDYVLLHELVHTRHLNHGPEFWASFLACEPRAKDYRRQIRRHRPELTAGDMASAVS